MQGHTLDSRFIRRLLAGALLMVFCLTGCGEKDTAPGEEQKAASTSANATEEPEKTWTITSYPSTAGGQAMIYTIEDDAGHFAIIDGGFSDDAEQLWKIILDHKKHVDVWILTHPHPDHVGAFDNLMLSLPDKFKVDQIYMPKVDRAVYEEKQKYYDDIGYYYMMEEAIEGLDQVTYLKEGDSVDLFGLQMDVYSAWDDYVNSLKDHLPNSGSLVFKLSGKSESMLFLSDIERAMEAPLLERHAEELKADYVQCAHHGNTLFKKGLYSYVQPKVALMDANDGILATDTWYHAWEVKEELEAMGAEVVLWSDEPYTITLN